MENQTVTPVTRRRPKRTKGQIIWRIVRRFLLVLKLSEEVAKYTREGSRMIIT